MTAVPLTADSGTEGWQHHPAQCFLNLREVKTMIVGLRLEATESECPGHFINTSGDSNHEESLGSPGTVEKSGDSETRAG